MSLQLTTTYEKGIFRGVSERFVRHRSRTKKPNDMLAAEAVKFEQPLHSYCCKKGG